MRELKPRPSEATSAGRGDRPDVSIIVPVHNNWRLTEACLASIQRSASRSTVGAEILLSDDLSTDETTGAWRSYDDGPWPLRYLRNEAQLGFLRNVNAASTEARGEFLCILNNDVVVGPGWLDDLVAALKVDPHAGAIGPMFLDARGRILECGAMVHSDGTGRQLGHGELPSDRRYAFVNDVDYVSAACLLLPTELFRRLGGFDDRYAPAYYEDTDLCLRIAGEGLHVRVAPHVKVVHYEGGSHGTSPVSGLKRYQEINRVKFVERWSERLGSHHPDSNETEDRVRTWRRDQAMAFYYPRPLTYERDSGALRIYRLMLQLRTRGRHVLLVNPEEGGPRLDALHRAGIETMRSTWGGDAPHLVRLKTAAPEAAIFSHYQTEELFAKSYYEFSRDTVRVLDTVDLHFLREARRIASFLGVKDDPVLTPLNASREALAELSSARRSDVTLVVSSWEKALLERNFFLEPERVHVVSNLHEPETSIRPFDEREGFVFLAGYAHTPNVDAILWIASEVWPAVRRQMPSAHLDIYGSLATTPVRRLHDPTEGVHFRGFVADHRDALAAARVMLAPLRYGAGVKGKLGEALAVGTPVVTNAVGAEGMDEDGAAMMVGASPRALAAMAVRLYTDRSEWEARSQAGLALLRERFSSKSNTEALLAAIADSRRLRSVPTAHELTSRLLWFELGNPGEPQTIEMNFRALTDRRGLASVSGRTWRYFRAHGLRAVSRRLVDEFRLRRARGRFGS